MECSIVASTSMSIVKYFCACSQQRGDEHTASPHSRSEAQQEARVVSKVFSRAENNVSRNKDRRLLYFGQVFHHDAVRKSIVNVGMVPLAIQFVFDACVPYFFISRCPLTQLEVILRLFRHPSLVEIEVVSSFSIVAFFIALNETNLTYAQLFKLCKIWSKLNFRTAHAGRKLNPF